MRMEPSVLPLSATMISAARPCRSMARLAFSMQRGSVVASFKHGMTNDTSTTAGPATTCAPARATSLLIQGEGGMAIRVLDHGDAGQPLDAIQPGWMVHVGGREEQAARRRGREIELGAEEPDAVFEFRALMLEHEKLPRVLHQRDVAAHEHGRRPRGVGPGDQAGKRPVAVA